MAYQGVFTLEKRGSGNVPREFVFEVIAAVGAEFVKAARLPLLVAHA